MITQMLGTLATYLHPTYHPKEDFSGIDYRLCSLTSMTKKASLISNGALRYTAEFFAFVFDATLGLGMILTPLYNTGAFLFNNTYARVRNILIARNALETNKQWNTTALKTWGVIAAIAGVYLLYRMQAPSVPKSMFSNPTFTPTFLPLDPKSLPSLSSPRNICLGTLAFPLGIFLVGKVFSFTKPEVDPITGQVNFWKLSYFRSTLGKYHLVLLTLLGIDQALSYSAASPNVLIAFRIAAIATSFLGAFAWKRLLFDISSMYTVWTQKEWWNQVSGDVIVGAIPLEQHVEALKKLGVTHVICMLEPFEQEKGLLSPATEKMWEAKIISFFPKHTRDFQGVPVITINDVITYMNTEREAMAKRSQKILFYVHCKAGRGRSATIAVADGLHEKFKKNPKIFDSSTILDVVKKEIGFVKEKRPKINLQHRQVAPIVEYCKKLVQFSGTKDFRKA